MDATWHREDRATHLELQDHRPSSNPSRRYHSHYKPSDHTRLFARDRWLDHTPTFPGEAYHWRPRIGKSRPKGLVEAYVSARQRPQYAPCASNNAKRPSRFLDGTPRSNKWDPLDPFDIGEGSLAEVVDCGSGRCWDRCPCFVSDGGEDEEEEGDRKPSTLSPIHEVPENKQSMVDSTALFEQDSASSQYLSSNSVSQHSETKVGSDCGLFSNMMDVEVWRSLRDGGFERKRAYKSYDRYKWRLKQVNGATGSLSSESSTRTSTPGIDNVAKPTHGWVRGSRRALGKHERRSEIWPHSH